MKKTPLEKLRAKEKKARQNIIVDAAEQVFATKEVREKDGKGRHSTNSRNLIRLECGAMIIDTPGMRELGNIIAGTFRGTAELRKN